MEANMDDRDPKAVAYEDGMRCCITGGSADQNPHGDGDLRAAWANGFNAEASARAAARAR